MKSKQEILRVFMDNVRRYCMDKKNNLVVVKPELLQEQLDDLVADIGIDAKHEAHLLVRGVVDEVLSDGKNETLRLVLKDRLFEVLVQGKFSDVVSGVGVVESGFIDPVDLKES